jgi:sigma-B regulation protein RsbU (phosphoserine phosphatase)
MITRERGCFSQPSTLHLEATGSLLGISRDLPISEQTVQLYDNDVLVLYTDGVSESRDEKGIQFGCERLAQKLEDCCHLPAQEIAHEVLKELRSFAGPNPFDDATLVVIKPTRC